MPGSAPGFPDSPPVAVSPHRRPETREPDPATFPPWRRGEATDSVPTRRRGTRTARAPPTPPRPAPPLPARPMGARAAHRGPASAGKLAAGEKFVQSQAGRAPVERGTRRPERKKMSGPRSEPQAQRTSRRPQGARGGLGGSRQPR